MLSRQDKKEMLADSASKKRKVAFRQAEELLNNLMPSQCLDDYIDFLTDIQKIFSPFVPSHKKTVTKFNKL